MAMLRTLIINENPKLSTPAGVARAKRELIEELPSKGIAVLNADDQRVRGFQRIHPGRTILFGFADDAEVRAENLQMCPNGSHFRSLGVDFRHITDTED